MQWYDPTSLCWFDIQKQPPTAEAAGAAYPGGKQCRTMEVTPEGGRPLLNMKTYLIIAATLLLAGSALADTFSPLFDPRLGERQELKARKTYGQAEGVRENALRSLYHFPHLESCFLGNLAFVHLENVDEAHFDIRSNG